MWNELLRQVFCGAKIDTHLEVTTNRLRIADKPDLKYTV